MTELDELMERYKKVWSTWDVPKLLKRYRDIIEQRVRIEKEFNAIKETIRQRLTCPRCHTNEHIQTNFYQKWNNVECLRCYLETPQYETIEQALEAWDKVCQALSELEPEQPTEPMCPANEEFENG